MRVVAVFRGALLAITAAGLCPPAVAAQSANDINHSRIIQRDLTRSIPAPGPTSPGPSANDINHPRIIQRDLTRSIPAPAPSTSASVPHRHSMHRRAELQCPRTQLQTPAPSSCAPVFVEVEADTPSAPEPVALPPPVTPVTPSRPIIVTHDMIEKLQMALQEAGPYSGPISGVFDLPTRNALITWQRAHGKRPTGSLNATTLDDFGIVRE